MITSSLNVVLCRIGAVLLFVQAAENVGVVVPQAMIFSGSFNAATAYMSLLLATPLIGGFALWIYGGRLAWNGTKVSTAAASSAPGFDLVAAGTYVLGLYVVLIGITSMTYTELTLLSQKNHTRSDPSIITQHMAVRDSYSMQIALGVLLVIGRRFFARVFPVTRN